MIVASSKPQPGKSVAETHPEIAAQADGWDASKISHGSNKRLDWICERGHRWKTQVQNRTKLGSNCPYCTGLRAISGENDLVTTHPELAAQADGWDPRQVGGGSGKKLSWKCDKGHRWDAAVETRAKRGYGCPYCSRRDLIPGETDLATTHPHIAVQADGWDPSKVMAGTNKKLPWVCELGHRWTTMPIHRLNGTGCPVCANRKVLRGFNDLATTHPEIAAEADGWDPTKVSFGSGRVCTWKCSLGHKWRTACNWRTSQISNCPYCSNQKVLSGFNDLATTHPDIAAEADGWDPTKVSAGTGKSLKWKCSEGHRWVTRGADRTRGDGCPSCAVYGFDPNKDGWLYFLDHDEWQMFQIGITNFPDDRLARHKGIGWTALEIRGAMDGAATRDLETAILRSLKRRGAVFANKSDGRKFDGWSESWLKSSVKVSGLNDLLDFVHEDESM